MNSDENEEKILRSIALENAKSILLARERAERELLRANEALERKADELAQQREWFRVTLASIGDAVIATDTRGKVTFLNPAAEQLTGWPSSAAEGQALDHVLRIVNEKTGQPAVNPVTKVLESGLTVGLANQTAMIARDGKETSIEDSAAPIKDSRGMVSGAVMVLHDVSDRRRAEEAVRRSERLLSDFFENATVGLHWVGPDGMVLRANRAEFELLGYTEAEYVGQHISKFHADEEAIREILTQLDAGNTLIDRAASLRCKDGSLKHVLISSNVLQENGKFIHTRCFTRDITDLKQAEEDLRESEARFRAMFDHAAVGIAVVRLDGRFERVNRRFCDILAYSTVELCQLTIADLTYPDDMPKTEDEIRRLLAGVIPEYVIEKRYVRKDGSLVWCLTTVALANDLSGQPWRLVGVIEDITQRKLGENALRLSEQFNRTIIESSRDCIKTLELDGTLVWINEYGRQALGLRDLSGVLGKSWVEFWRPEDRPAAQAALQTAAAGGNGKLVGGFAVNGETRHWDVVLTPILDLRGKPERLLAVSRDVTEQQQAQEIRLRLAAVVESSDDAIISKTMDGIITSWNQGAERIFGYAAKEAIGQPISMLIPADRQDEEPKILKRILQGERIEHYETLRRRKDGTILNISLTISPIKSAEGRLVGASKIARDITERKRVEEALRSNEARVRHLFDFSQAVMNNLAEGLFTVDTAGLVTFINPAAEAMFGWTSRELLGRKLHDVAHYRHPDGSPFPASDCPGLCVLREGMHLREHEDTFIRKDGTSFPIIFSASPLMADGQSVGTVVAFRDDSQRRQTQLELQGAFQGLEKAREQLAHHAVELERQVAARTAELHEANSQLEDYVYSIAHDLRHPLRAMQGFSEILLESHSAGLDDVGQNHLKQITHSAELMDKLLLDLLAYGRAARGPLEMRDISVQQVWDVAQFQCGTAIRETAAFLETMEPLPVVVAHETTLIQILINLLSNALKFTAPGVAPRIKLFAEKRGDWVRLCLEDNGIGIAPENHERIFRVFERLGGTQYEGTGIGLAIVRKGAEHLGGRAGVESDLGKGSRFWVELPLAKELKPALVAPH